MVTRCFPVAKIVGSSPIGVAYVIFVISIETVLEPIGVKDVGGPTREIFIRCWDQGTMLQLPVTPDHSALAHTYMYLHVINYS